MQMEKGNVPSSSHKLNNIPGEREYKRSESKLEGFAEFYNEKSSNFDDNFWGNNRISNSVPSSPYIQHRLWFTTSKKKNTLK